MAKQNKPQIVHCRYTKCCNLHDSNELLKDDAYCGGNGKYYHHDCYYMLQTTNKIRDLFLKEINPLLTSAQIGQLVSIIQNIVYKKGVNIDMVLFALEYMIKNKPGALKFPAGLYYVIQNKDINDAWIKVQESKKIQELKDIMKKEINKNDVGEIGEWTIEDTATSSSFRPKNNSRFSRVIGA